MWFLFGVSSDTLRTISSGGLPVVLAIFSLNGILPELHPNVKRRNGKLTGFVP
jgi:hypothetical protein